MLCLSQRWCFAEDGSFSTTFCKPSSAHIAQIVNITDIRTYWVAQKRQKINYRRGLIATNKFFWMIINGVFMNFLLHFYMKILQKDANLCVCIVCIYFFTIFFDSIYRSNNTLIIYKIYHIEIVWQLFVDYLKYNLNQQIIKLHT